MIRPCGKESSERASKAENRLAVRHTIMNWYCEHQRRLVYDPACARKRPETYPSGEGSRLNDDSDDEDGAVDHDGFFTSESVGEAARDGHQAPQHEGLQTQSNSRSSDEGAEQSTDRKHTDDETGPDVGEGATVDDSRGRAAGEPQLKVVLLRGIIRSDGDAGSSSVPAPSNAP